MCTLETRKSMLETKKYEVQKAQLFCKLKMPWWFKAEQNDVIRHQSETNADSYDSCQMSIY